MVPLTFNVSAAMLRSLTGGITLASGPIQVEIEAGLISLKKFDVQFLVVADWYMVNACSTA